MDDDGNGGAAVGGIGITGKGSHSQPRKRVEGNLLPKTKSLKKLSFFDFSY